MYFVCHDQQEVSVEETRSHVNEHEASFIVQLCRYLLLQGYKASEVTILTMYSGQLFRIKSIMRQFEIMKNVRATVVDNYQGEENEIILLSFVRSNDEGNIGFLSIDNRVNVALSRAKKGLFAIGNFNCLKQKSALWKKLVEHLQREDAFGSSLPLYCQNHPEKRTNVAKAEDFRSVPEGGCNEPCTIRLPCGHSCPSTCHVYDKEHQEEKSQCYKSCDKIVCSSSHRCPDKCHYGKECGDCKYKVTKFRALCQHSVVCFCSKDPSTVFCPEICNRRMSCGHQCKAQCSSVCDPKMCKMKMTLSAACGHKVEINCFESSAPAEILRKCKSPCNQILKCGHPCGGSCGGCQQGRLHQNCRKICKRILVCGHECSSLCSNACPPCTKNCFNLCSHSSCNKKCGNPCASCMEKCSWKCEHVQCTQLCHEPCDRELCSQSCPKELECGHKCIGVCGEPCPRLCRVCNKDEVEEILFGHEDEEDARFIELVDCKNRCIIEVSGLVGWMQQSNDENSSSIQLKSCPKCKTIIRRTLSLNKYLQGSLKDIEKVKLRTFGDEERNKMEQKQLRGEFEEIKKFEKHKHVSRHTSHKWLQATVLLLQNKTPLSSMRLGELGNQLTILKELDKLIASIEKIAWTEFLKMLIQRIDRLLVFVEDFRGDEQMMNDIKNEISFLQFVEAHLTELPKNNGDEMKKLVLESLVICNTLGPATESLKQRFSNSIKKAINLFAPGLQITVAERDMVLRAIGLNKGHWFKCPNGHIYAIGECGGPMQRSKCPDCNEAIGGTSHSFVAGNRQATEMDGAVAPAYPTALMRQHY